MLNTAKGKQQLKDRFHLTKNQNRLEIVNLLLSSKSIKVNDGLDGEQNLLKLTPLLMAIRSRNDEIAKKIIQHPSFNIKKESAKELKLICESKEIKTS